jgi:hypothetical protein
MVYAIVRKSRYAVARQVLGFARVGLLILFAAIASQAASLVRPADDHPEVDLELILAVDASPSISRTEQKVQRDGYVSAFRRADLASAIESGETGRIAVLYLEWAGPSQQTVVIPWTILDTLKDAQALADELAERSLSADELAEQSLSADKLAERSLTGGPSTSISGALWAAKDLFAESGIHSPRRVIDVSGDGPNNVGPPLDPVRDSLFAQGVTINGLPITLPSDGTVDRSLMYAGPNLQAYFEHCVIGGQDAFAIGVTDVHLFATAIRRKLVREISMRPSQVIPAAYGGRSEGTFDCQMFGEGPGR